MTTCIKTSSLLALFIALNGYSHHTVFMVRGQEPQEIHPWLTYCPEPYPCYIDYFCSREMGFCQRCPKDGIDTTKQDCLNLNLTDSRDAEDCLASCVRPNGGDLCSLDNPCDEGRFFCNFSDDDSDNILSSSDTGVCQECKNDISECFTDDTIKSKFGVEECVLCDVRLCYPLHYSITEETNNDGSESIIASYAMRGSPSLFASGPLVSCTNLIHDGETTCDNNEEDITGSICLVDDFTKNTYYVGVVQKCTDLGGAAVIFYGDYSPIKPNNEPWKASLSFQPSTIPSVSVSFDDGTQLKQNKIGEIIKVNTTDVGDGCYKGQFCSDDIPCVGTSGGKYCDYKWADDDGWCQTCPENEDGDPYPLSCFFPMDDDWGKITGQKAVESCALTCGGALSFPDCKFCPKDISGFDFGIDSDEGKCDFCPANDVQYPNREFPLFGDGVKCWQVQKFFKNTDVNADAKNCRLVQMMNYICGCAGPGYGGASTETKKRVLVWLPRMMAILSFFGSAFIVYDASKTKKRRKKLLNQLLIALSVCDILGSCAYAFTSFPIPEDDLIPIYGAHGNDATCKAQGFFIQMGTISAFMNVSMAIYYLLVITYGWPERRLMNVRLMLFACPIAVGLAFAFAGIPFYGNLILWCNNTAPYWPDIPVAIAIGLATIIMLTVCWDVYKKEKLSSKWRGGKGSAVSSKKRTGGGGGGSTKLSTKVFWQCFFYLMAFYLTWPLYLALQYDWANGKDFTNYGFILTAGTMVPLQGFWNMLVYVRPRYFKDGVGISMSTLKSKTTAVSSIFFRSSDSPKEGGHNATSKLSTVMDVEESNEATQSN
eukprot:CAMPEP_0185728338 /NCGR_PEP_ID=MMETSP1171-20130828/3716_1 /TAXON_ID=374046 /ORGANISM="Helicotheca tamensis, Strain CCMP826" /LENGTH=823 /DNA_ID=CAMNT_0028397037 /DNA_START=55 /DNA_END=2526 /DNA_ORIENTATION=+